MPSGKGHDDGAEAPLLSAIDGAWLAGQDGGQDANAIGGGSAGGGGKPLEASSARGGGAFGGRGGWELDVDTDAGSVDAGRCGT